MGPGGVVVDGVLRGKGAVVEISAADAQRINRTSPGLLRPIQR